MPEPTTALDFLIAALRGNASTPDGQTPPAAILWADGNREFQPLLAALKEAVPELTTLGDYAPAQRTGPAIWLRCVVDRTLTDVVLPTDRTPIVYLPGVSHTDLSAGEACPEALRPLVELQFRGTRWKLSNQQDWTLRGFLSSREGVGLDLAKDELTAAALRRAVSAFFAEPLAIYRQKRLEAEDFDALLAGDEVREMLNWLNDPAHLDGMVKEQREAFVERCRTRFDCDPLKDGRLVAAQKLAGAEGAWGAVWERYEQAPVAYAGVVDALRKTAPAGLFGGDTRYPQKNDEAEVSLAAELEAALAESTDRARQRIGQLEAEHGTRRSTVWAKQDLCPWAQLLKPLAALARVTGSALGGDSAEALASAYETGGWEADAAACAAIAGRVRPQRTVAEKLVRHLLLPWQEAAALRLQAICREHPLPDSTVAPPVFVAEGGCVLFADGLRYDVGRRLADCLTNAGRSVEWSSRWAALPTVTNTAKSAVSPAAAAISGEALEGDFLPQVESSGKSAEAPALRAAIAVEGYQVMAGAQTPGPRSDKDRGWSEAGEIDQSGHKQGIRLADELERHIEDLDYRIGQLFAAGWKSVRVVTDHGWLLMPGGLPKVDLPKHVTESRWARCAALAKGASPDVPTGPWHWNPLTHFAHAPGVACFNKTEVYAHGGISLQECLTPDLLVSAGGDAMSGRAASDCVGEVERPALYAGGRTTPQRERVRIIRRGGAGGESVVAAREGAGIRWPRVATRH